MNPLCHKPSKPIILNGSMLDPLFSRCRRRRRRRRRRSRRLRKSRSGGWITTTRRPLGISKHASQWMRGFAWVCVGVLVCMCMSAGVSVCVCACLCEKKCERRSLKSCPERKKVLFTKKRIFSTSGVCRPKSKAWWDRARHNGCWGKVRPWKSRLRTRKLTFVCSTCWPQSFAIISDLNAKVNLNKNGTCFLRLSSEDFRKMIMADIILSFLLPLFFNSIVLRIF